MEAYRERVVAESNDLRDKLNKLEAFMNSDAFDALDREDKQLLRRQNCYMEDYFEVLRKRIARFTQPRKHQ